MKKLFNNAIAPLASLALLASLFTSCSKKSQLTPVNIKPIVYQNENVIVKVDPKLELLLIGLRLAEVDIFKNNYYTQDYSQFVDGVDSLFAKQKEHPFVKNLRARGKNYKKSILSILQISQYISDDMTNMTIKQKEIPEPILDFWKGINLKSFIAQFNDFAISSNYERIWVLYEAQLKRQAINVQEYFSFNKSITDWISKYYFSSDKNIEYELYASTLTAGYNFALLSETEDNKITIKEICAAYWNKDNDGNKFQSCYEVSSGYVYSLVKKHWSLISEEANRFAKSIYEENQSTEKITEYAVQSFTSQLLAFFCIFDFDLIRNDEEWYTAVYNAISQAFLIKNVDNFLSLTEEYQTNREKYPDFESFFVNYIPEAIKSF